MSETLQKFVSPLNDLFVTTEHDAETGLALPFNERVDNLYMFLVAQPQCDCHTEHMITPGLYSRTAIVPKGAYLISKTHLHEHQFVMSKGVIHMVDERLEPVRLEGFNRGVTPAMTRRVVWVEEEVTFTTFHPTTKTTIEEIEAELYLEDGLQASKNPDHIDYLLMCKDIGLEPEQIRIITENHSNLIAMPEGEGLRIEIKDSTVNGKGMFAKVDVESGERIAPVTIKEKRTPAGRYINHSQNFNAIFVSDDNFNMNLVSVKPIPRGAEVLVDYRQTYLTSLHAASQRQLINTK